MLKPWRARNSSSRNCSGFRRCPDGPSLTTAFEAVFEVPHVGGQPGGELAQPFGHSRCDRVSEIVGVPRTELAGLEPFGQRVDLDPRGGRVGRHTEWAVHGHQVPVADELVQLDGVNVPRGAGVGRVQDQEHVIGIHMHLRHLVALRAVLDCQRMEREHVAEHAFGRLVPGRDVQPHQAVRPGEQVRCRLDRMLRDPGRTDPSQRHVRASCRSACRGRGGFDLDDATACTFGPGLAVRTVQRCDDPAAASRACAGIPSLNTRRRSDTKGVGVGL